jgi:nitroimidazol reductase NimA-like FMN-containing flavoprotein (pyridoxamine 5'-phosphate oxidase superfamily)
MFIHDMTEADCLNTLAHSRFGRLACSHENQPYIVPFYFVYENSYLYGFTTPGQKVEWMRSNPLVCVELDDVVNVTEWMSIIIFGSYEELLETQEDKMQADLRRPTNSLGAGREVPQTPYEKHLNLRQHAHALLQQHGEWWEPGAISNTHRHSHPFKPVFYRIHIDRISGRRGTPSRGDSSDVNSTRQTK